jgi:hypothetical protein
MGEIRAPSIGVDDGTLPGDGVCFGFDMLPSLIFRTRHGSVHREPLPSWRRKFRIAVRCQAVA